MSLQSKKSCLTKGVATNILAEKRMPSSHDLAEKHSSEEEEEDGGRSLGSMSG